LFRSQASAVEREEKRQAYEEEYKELKVGVIRKLLLKSHPLLAPFTLPVRGY
jgi:hypothetical protein